MFTKNRKKIFKIRNMKIGVSCNSIHSKNILNSFASDRSTYFFNVYYTFRTSIHNILSKRVLKFFNICNQLLGNYNLNMIEDYGSQSIENNLK